MPDALAGYGIAITRPLEQAQELAGRIAAEGGQPILFPLLAIAPLDDPRAFLAVLDDLEKTDWAIFISSNAVEQGMPALVRRHPQRPAGLRFAAIGPATTAELKRFDVDEVLMPKDRYDSESLLALPQMQEVQDRRILIFRGVGGRELLAEQLQARGAEVRFAECYRRVNPQRDAGDLPRLWQNKQLHALVVTSSEALRNLVALADDAEWLRSTPVFVNHARIGELAQRHGLNAIVADVPGDEGMLNCLIRNRNLLDKGFLENTHERRNH